MEEAPEHNALDHLRFLVQNAPLGMKEEFGRTGGNWLSRILTQVTILLAEVEFALDDKTIDEEYGQKLISRIDNFARRLREKEDEYSLNDPDRDIADNFEREFSEILDK